MSDTGVRVVAAAAYRDRSAAVTERGENIRRLQDAIVGLRSLKEDTDELIEGIIDRFRAVADRH